MRDFFKPQFVKKRWAKPNLIHSSPHVDDTRIRGTVHVLSLQQLFSIRSVPFHANNGLRQYANYGIEKVIEQNGKCFRLGQLSDVTRDNLQITVQ